jgi:uroporphyrinogen-III synthase
LKIRKILVSQPEPPNEKSPYHELADKNKVKIDFKPFIHVEGVSSKDFRQERIDILDHSAIVFTSRTAIDHFFRIAEDLRVAIPDTMKYFCTSESVAYYLQKYIVYRKRKIFHGKNGFGGLLEIILKHKDEKYLVPLSDQHKKEIPEAMQKHGVEHTAAVMYNTVCSDLSNLSTGDYDILVFFSPSGIKSLKQNFPHFKQNSTFIAAFGPATHKAVEEAGLRLDVVAPNPEAPSMTMALEHFIVEYNKINK